MRQMLAGPSLPAFVQSKVRAKKTDNVSSVERVIGSSALRSLKASSKLFACEIAQFFLALSVTYTCIDLCPATTRPSSPFPTLRYALGIFLI